MPEPTDQREPFSWRARANSFVYAFRGLGWLLRREHNAWIHLALAVAAVTAGVWWRIERWEWAAVVSAVAGVLSAEALNTSVETLADAVRPERHPLVGRAKDRAAAVLLAAGGAAAVGLIIFGPRVWALVSALVYSSPSK